MACRASMEFCTRPLRLTADTGYAVYSSCPDADPMSVSVSAADPLPATPGLPISIQSPRGTAPAATRVRSSQPPPPPPRERSPPPSPQPASAFVRVSRDRRGFERSGQPYRFVGTTLTKRIEKVAGELEVLYRVKAPYSKKAMITRSAKIPKALYGCEIAPANEKALQTLRTRMSKTLAYTTDQRSAGLTFATCSGGGGPGSRHPHPHEACHGL